MGICEQFWDTFQSRNPFVKIMKKFSKVEDNMNTVWNIFFACLDKKKIIRN